MIVLNKNQFLTIIFIFLSLNFVEAQEEKPQEEKTQQNNRALYRELDFLELRGTHVTDAVVGTSMILGDYPDSELDIFFRIGYKYHIISNLNVNLSFNKYSIALDETTNLGFMSFDLNLEYLVSPYSEFSPFVFGGYGYNASNYFEETHTKVQFGLGLEYIFMDGFGVKLFGDYNFVLSNEMEGLIIPDQDESFLRVGLGLNLYFGGNKRKEQILKNIDTVINSNLIK
ncbi:outer membrane beta-barrel protein [Winogradskyella sp. HB-48]|uniref:outer membrane beta-barrel protein n=1 Tax=Winogradskyella sp. HB-48 TaxID=3416808 RepID=UPI003CFAF780